MGSAYACPRAMARAFARLTGQGYVDATGNGISNGYPPTSKPVGRGRRSPVLALLRPSTNVTGHSTPWRRPARGRTLFLGTHSCPTAGTVGPASACSAARWPARSAETRAIATEGRLSAEAALTRPARTHDVVHPRPHAERCVRVRRVEGACRCTLRRDKSTRLLSMAKSSTWPRHRSTRHRGGRRSHQGRSAVAGGFSERRS